MIDISHVINTPHHSTAFQVIREATGAYVGGIWQSGALATLDAIGSITPATANDMLKLPEGEKQSETMRLITQFELRISKNSVVADIVSYLGHRYRVFAPSEWRGNGFSDVLIQKEDNG